MKKLCLLLLCSFSLIPLFAQTDGISYQAVIIGPDKQELPGVDASGNIIPDAEIKIRFSIIDATNTIVYQEVRTTNTDMYGRVNLIIGTVDPVAFATIEWDGTPKDLQVEIDFKNSGNFLNMSRDQLTFLPFAYHRNIRARGTLIVDGTSDLNGELIVQGPANLNGSLKVEGPTNLENTFNVNNMMPANFSGKLQVDSAAKFNSSITVDGISNLNNELHVNNGMPVHFSGNLQVDNNLLVVDSATFTGIVSFNAPTEFVELNVHGAADLHGQVTVNANMDTSGTQGNYQAYPLLVKGSMQGIAIKVNGNRSIANNYISFWDDTQMWGRIEGITLDEQQDDPEYKWEHGFKITDIALSVSDIAIFIAELLQKTTIKLPATFTSSTACLGIGACVTAPIPSLIIEATSDVILKIANGVVKAVDLAKTVAEEVTFINFKTNNIGVSYQSGAGDYAEWLPKLNVADVFKAGELVGIKNGYVTKTIWGAEKVMIVSTNPIVLGNMPQPNNESNYVKIAFMGQVPAIVVGEITPGDYILPHEMGSGFAKAVHPKDMKTLDYKKVAGVAWNQISEITPGLNFINVAVGINTNDLSEVLAKQEMELKELKSDVTDLKKQVNKTNEMLKKLLPQNKTITNDEYITDLNKDITPTNGNYEIKNAEEILFFNLTNAQIEDALLMAKEQYVQLFENQQKLKNLILNDDTSLSTQTELAYIIPIRDHPFFKRLDNDPGYKDEIISFIRSAFEKGLHTHKKYAHSFTGLELHR